MAKYHLRLDGEVVQSLGWRGCFLSAAFHNSTIVDGDIYQFGVAGGYSMQVIARILATTIIKQNLCPRLFGFDVFTGMPVELMEPDKQLDEPGSFNLLQSYNTDNIHRALYLLRNDILSNIDTGNKLYLIPGLVEETLTVELMNIHKFRPAFYIDMDMDIYSPTKFALDFLVKNKIIIEGTIIGFDDWGQNLDKFPIYSCGESRAFREVVEKYNIKYDTFHTTHRAEQTIVIIKQVNS